MDLNFNMSQWLYIREKLKTNHPQLIDADLIWGHSSRNSLLEMLSTKLEIRIKDLTDEIESF